MVQCGSLKNFKGPLKLKEGYANLYNTSITCLNLGLLEQADLIW
jgi:hypothetical protein